ncbi:MAG TPA: hypothetical protein ENJ95_15670 [Bacteroidetes bacterium]|nr:hypothetical protein [Bacteroidota bacterium]
MNLIKIFILSLNPLIVENPPQRYLAKPVVTSLPQKTYSITLVVAPKTIRDQGEFMGRHWQQLLVVQILNPTKW